MDEERGEGGVCATGFGEDPDGGGGRRRCGGSGGGGCIAGGGGVSTSGGAGIPGQGNNGAGGTGDPLYLGTGGGGAGQSASTSNRNGGAGIYSLITGANVAYAGGGGGRQPGLGGVGGGGAGAGPASPSPAVSGTGNSGGGGGAGADSGSGLGASGGSGIVIIRYPVINVAEIAQSKISRVSSVTKSSNAVYETEQSTITVNTVSASNGDVLYYTTSGNADVYANAQGQFQLNNNTGSFTLITEGSVPDNEVRELIVQIRRNSNTGPILATTSVGVSPLIGDPATLSSVDYLVVAGGGGAHRAGGGAGGLITGNISLTSPAIGISNVTIEAGGVGGAQSPYSTSASTRGGNTVISIVGTPFLAVGGGAGWHDTFGGTPGGSGGRAEGTGSQAPGGAGNVNTGGGGGGSEAGWAQGMSGGSGIFVLRYPTSARMTITGGNVIVENGSKFHVFTNSGNLNISSLDLFNGKVSLVSSIVPLSNVLTGGNITFRINTINAANGEVLYYSTNNQPNAAFTTGNIGSFIVNGNVGTVILNSTSNVIDEQYFDLQVRRNSVTGLILKQGGNVYIPNRYIQATGGTITDSGGYRIHAFTTSGNLVITGTGLSSTPNVEIILVAGGGGGGSAGSPVSGPSPAGIGPMGGGGGAGGLVHTNVTISSTGSYSIIIGGGGIGQKQYSLWPSWGGSPITVGRGTPGSNTTAFSIVTVGGGGGGKGGGGPWPGGPPDETSTGFPGGSGGGGTYLMQQTTARAGGLGIAGQGNPGGSGPPLGYQSGAGGGGGGAGQAGQPAPSRGGNGYVISWITPDYGTSGPLPGRYFAAGGGGGGNSPTIIPAGGFGGGGSGAGTRLAGNTLAGSGSQFTGGGGGGGTSISQGWPSSLGIHSGGDGGSGIVIIRYPIA